MPRTRRTSREHEKEHGHAGCEAEIHRHLARFGVSGPGREWLVRALHPASEKRSPGLPDESSTFVLRPDYRITGTIQAPGGATSWDCYIWLPPGDLNALYWATAPSPADFSAAIPPNGAEVGVIQLQTSGTESSPTWLYEALYGSTTDSSLTNVPSLRATAFRHQFKSLTIEQIASAVSDQGQVYAGQFSPLLRTTGMLQLTGYDSGVPIPGSDPVAYYGLIAQHYTTILPTSEVALSRMNPDFYQMPSRDGVYMPLRLSGPSQPFARSVPLGNVHQLNGGAGYLSQDVSAYPIGAILVPTPGELAAAPTPLPWVFQVLANKVQSPNGNFIAIPGRTLFDTGYDHMNVGVVIFRGLNGSGGGGFGAALQVKMIAGLEVAPTPSQGDSVFAERPAPYEPRALEAYYKLCLELKGVYPARFNSFESILDAIGDVAKKVWSNVEPAIVGGLSNLANTGISMLSSAVGRRMGGFGGAAAVAPRVAYRAPSAARSMSTVRSTARPKPPRARARVRVR